MRDDAHSLKKLSYEKGKFTKKPTQLQTVFRYLQNHVATATMVSYATGVPQKNICRYKKNLEQSGLIAETEKKYCDITNHKAFFLTTDTDLFPVSNQLKMF